MIGFRRFVPRNTFSRVTVGMGSVSTAFNLSYGIANENSQQNYQNGYVRSIMAMAMEKIKLGKLVCKAVLPLLLILALSGIAYAGVLQLDEENIADGKVIQDGNVYRIIYYTETYLPNGSVTRRIVVESESGIKALENETSALFAEIGETNDELSGLKANASETSELISNNAAAMGLLGKQGDLLESEIEHLQADKSKVESLLTSNVVLSPMAFRASLIIFVLLLILVISARTAGIFSHGREHEKTPYEESYEEEEKKA